MKKWGFLFLCLLLLLAGCSQGEAAEPEEKETEAGEISTDLSDEPVSAIINSHGTKSKRAVKESRHLLSTFSSFFMIIPTDRTGLLSSFNIL